MDLALTETLDGGDIQLVNNDLALVFGVENMPYLGMFGGNPGFPTQQQQVQSENYDWWGNSLLMNGNTSQQFNSFTEHIAQTVALNSSGRASIENAVKKDLEYMKPFAKVEVSVYLVSDDRLVIEINVTPVNESTKTKVVNFKKRSDGDFYFFDFNDDFFL
jgi:hypothetical protein